MSGIKGETLFDRSKRTFMEILDKVWEENGDHWFVCAFSFKDGVVTMHPHTTYQYPYDALVNTTELFAARMSEVNREKDNPKPEPLPLAPHLRDKLPQGYRVLNVPEYLRPLDVTPKKEEQNEESFEEPTGLGIDEEIEDGRETCKEMEEQTDQIAEKIQESSEGIDGFAPSLGPFRDES